MTPPRPSWGARLRVEREGLNLSLEQVATALEIRPSTLSRWENNRIEPRYAHKRMLSGFYEVSMSELFPYEELSA